MSAASPSVFRRASRYTARCAFFFFLMIRRPPRSTLFPTRRSSDLHGVDAILNRLEQLLLALLGAALEIVRALDRKSTRLNSSHSQISYALFCLKKKNA